MKKRNNLIFLLLLLLLTLPALIGILHSGFFLSDDGNWMVIRFSAFFEALGNGQFPVRFLSRLNNGYGYPVADFLYPLFMYIGTPIHLLKINFVDTIKIILIFSMVISSVFSFLWLRKFFGNLSSLVGAVAYSLFPYHLWDLYKRGSVGEVLALGIVPFILWAIELGSLSLAGFGYGLLVVSHNSLALLFLPIIFLYQFFKEGTSNTMKSLKAIGLGLLLSAFFWLPALYDKQFTVFDSTVVSDFSQYFISDFALFGLVSATAVIGSLAFLKKKDVRLIYFLSVAIVSVFLSTQLSEVVWNNIPMVGLIQFPFRIVSLLILAVSFLLAYHVENINSKLRFPLTVTYLFIIFISAWQFLVPKTYQYNPDSFYSTNQDSTTVRNEYMPKWVKNLPLEPRSSVASVLDGQEKLNIQIVSPNNLSIQAYFPSARTIQINTVYFPGWEVMVDGKNSNIDYNSNGLIRVNVPSGSHNIVVKFGETKIRLIADAISLFGLFLTTFLFSRRKKI